MSIYSMYVVNKSGGLIFSKVGARVRTHWLALVNLTQANTACSFGTC